MEQSSKKRKRLTLVLRTDLIDAVQEKAAVVSQGPNQFVNMCVEGILLAMEAEDPNEYEMPILELYNKVKGRMSLSSKAAMKLCSVLVPQLYDIDRHEKQFLVGLINKHEGKLSPQIFSGYCKLAEKMNQDRIANERQLAKLHAKSK